MLTNLLILISTLQAPPSAAQVEAMIYYVRIAAAEQYAEWLCQTGREEAVRERTINRLNSKLAPRQVGLLMAEYDRELSRSGYETKATPAQREKDRVYFLGAGNSCDRAYLKDLTDGDLKRLGYIDHPERMSEIE